MASSRRGTAVWRNDGWNTWAKQNVIPASSAFRATWLDGQVQPDAQCLEHIGGTGRRRRRPVAVLDHLRARAGSDQGGHGGDVDGVELVSAGAHDVQLLAGNLDRVGVAQAWRRTRPESSSTVSPLALRATRKPAICAGVASPDMMVSMAQAVLSAVRSAPLISAEISRGQVLRRRLQMPVKSPPDAIDRRPGTDQYEPSRELFRAISRLCRKSPPKRRFALGSTDFYRHNVYVTSATHAPSTPAHPTLNRPNMVSVGTVVWLSSELMFFAGLFAMYFTLRSTSGADVGGRDGQAQLPLCARQHDRPRGQFLYLPDGRLRRRTAAAAPKPVAPFQFSRGE